MRCNMLIMVVSLFLLSCSNSNEIKENIDETEEYSTSCQLGKYVYLDETGCLHADRKCSVLCHNRNEKGMKDNYQVNFVETMYLSNPPDSYSLYVSATRLLNKYRK